MSRDLEAYRRAREEQRQAEMRRGAEVSANNQAREALAEAFDPNYAPTDSHPLHNRGDADFRSWRAGQDKYVRNMKMLRGEDPDAS